MQHSHILGRNIYESNFVLDMMFQILNSFMCAVVVVVARKGPIAPGGQQYKKLERIYKKVVDIHIFMAQYFINLCV